jgi:hypothetical protein
MPSVLGSLTPAGMSDLTVAPEELLPFYAALRSGKGEFINGVRLAYPMGQSIA